MRILCEEFPTAAEGKRAEARLQNWYYRTEGVLWNPYSEILARLYDVKYHYGWYSFGVYVQKGKQFSVSAKPMIKTGGEFSTYEGEFPANWLVGFIGSDPPTFSLGRRPHTSKLKRENSMVADRTGELWLRLGADFPSEGSIAVTITWYE